jgi:hypothetical protein
MSYCQCGGFLGSGGWDGYSGRWCRCASPKQVLGHSYATGALITGHYISTEELQSIELLRTRLASAEEALLFYVDSRSWKYSHNQGGPACYGLISTVDREEIDSDKTTIGGKRAREHFAKFKERSEK